MITVFYRRVLTSMLMGVKWMHFDGTVTLGNVLVIGSFTVATLAFVIRFDERLKAIERWIKGHEVCNKTQIDILSEVRNDLSYLRGQNSGGPNLKERY